MVLWPLRPIMTYEGRERFLSGIKRDSTAVVACRIWEILSEGPSTLSIEKLCDSTGYSAHSVRRTLQFLERFGKLRNSGGLYRLNAAMFSIVYRRRLRLIEGDRLIRSM